MYRQPSPDYFDTEENLCDDSQAASRVFSMIYGHLFAIGIEDDDILRKYKSH